LTFGEHIKKANAEEESQTNWFNDRRTAKSLQQIPVLMRGDIVKARNPIVIHYVRDMDRAKTFYMTAFEVKPDFESPGWTTLDFGAILVALHIIPESHGSELPLPHAGLNLEVDNIEEIQSDIKRLGGRLIDLREPEGGVPVRVATFQDCEGNGFELRQQPWNPGYFLDRLINRKE
jgi:predicted enzyme related to lactoylglutathione lyase